MSSSQPPESDGRRASPRLASRSQPAVKAPLLRIVNVSDPVTRLPQAGGEPFIVIKTSDYVAGCSANLASRALKAGMGSYLHDGYYGVVLDDDGYFPSSGTMEVLVQDGVECKACLAFLLKMRVEQENLLYLDLTGNGKGVPVFPEYQQKKKPLSVALITDGRLEDVQIGCERVSWGQDMSDPPIRDFSGRFDSEAVRVRQYSFEKLKITTKMYKGWRGNLRCEAIKSVANDYHRRGEEEPTMLVFLVGLDDILAFSNAAEVVVEDIIRNFLGFFEICHEVLPEASIEWVGVGNLGPDHPRKRLLDAVVNGLNDAVDDGLMPAYLRFENLCDVGTDCGLNVEGGDVKWNDKFVIKVGKRIVNKIRACGKRHEDVEEPFEEGSAEPDDLPVADEERAVEADDDSSSGNNDGTGAAEGEPGSEGSVTPQNGSPPPGRNDEGIDEVSDREEPRWEVAVGGRMLNQGNERWFVRLPETDVGGHELEKMLRGGYCTRKGCAMAFFRTWPLLLEHLDTKHGATPCYVCWVFLEGSYRRPRHELSAYHTKGVSSVEDTMEVMANLANAHENTDVQAVALTLLKAKADRFFPPGWKPPRPSTAQPVDVDTEAGARDATAQVGPEGKNGEETPGGDQPCEDKEKAEKAETECRKETEAAAAVLPQSRGSVSEERAAGVSVDPVFPAGDSDSDGDVDIVAVQRNVDQIVEQFLDDDDDVAMKDAGEPEPVLMEVERPVGEVNGGGQGGGDHQPAKDGNGTDSAGVSDVGKGPADGMDESENVDSDGDSVSSESPLLIEESEDDAVKDVCVAPQRRAVQGASGSRVRKAEEPPLAEPRKPKMRKIEDRVRAHSVTVNAEQVPAKGSAEFLQQASPGGQPRDGVVERHDENVEQGLNASVEKPQKPPLPEEPKKAAFYKVFGYQVENDDGNAKRARARSLCMRSGLCEVGSCGGRFQLTRTLFKHLAKDHGVSCCFVCLVAFDTDKDLAVHRGLKRHADNRKNLLKCGRKVRMSLEEETRKAIRRWKEVEATAGPHAP